MASDPLILPRCRNWLRFIPSRFKSDTILNGDVVSLTVKRIDWEKLAARPLPEVSVVIDLSDLDGPRRLRTDLEGRVVEIGRRVG